MIPETDKNTSNVQMDRNVSAESNSNLPSQVQVIQNSSMIPNSQQSLNIETSTDYQPIITVGKTESVNSERSSNTDTNNDDISNSKKLNKRRKKANSACVYCRRSHMICDNLRPCKRCIKRGISHMCHDEPRSSKSKNSPLANDILNPSNDKNYLPAPINSKNITNNNISNNAVTTKMEPPKILDVSNKSSNNNNTNTQVLHNTPSSATINQQPFFYSEHAGSEFNSLTEFLSMIDDNEMMDSINLSNDPMLQKLDATNYFTNLNSATTTSQGSNIAIPNFNINNPSNQTQPSNNIKSTNIVDVDLSSDASQLSKMDQQQLNFLQQQLNAQQQKFFNQQQQQQQQQQHHNHHHQQQQQATLEQANDAKSQSQQEYHQQLHEHQQQQLFNQPLGITTADNQLQQKQIYDQNFAQNSSYKTSNQQHGQMYYPKSPILQRTGPHISDAARDKFFLTAADPTTEISPEERLKQVINAKLEAGLLKPYNYAKGYQRLQTYMDKYMSSSSRTRILKPLSRFRPGFRAIAKTLKDIDLILVEESFERMLLDYDRVFTSMAIPACLWRRTGEIYRGNKEFASLVEVSIEDLKNGKLTIYELMTEESSVNFWEKYGSIAFDKTQKAVLTSCNLRTKDGRKKKNCCFSFTIRRDRYNIPSCIVGNFIPIR